MYDLTHMARRRHEKLTHQRRQDFLTVSSVRDSTCCILSYPMISNLLQDT